RAAGHRRQDPRGAVNDRADWRRGGMIVVAGESLIDLILGADGRVEAVPGGGPYNVARTLGRLGQAVAFLGRLSTDRFGSMLRAGLAAENVDLGLSPAT